MITQTASTATKNFGGQKQLMSRPNANVSAAKPLLIFRLHRIFFPPEIHLVATLTLYKNTKNLLQIIVFLNKYAISTLNPLFKDLKQPIFILGFLSRTLSLQGTH